MTKKYGRTVHLPSSPGTTSDDRVMRDLSALRAASEVVITEKMDGENTTIFAHGCHPRSPDARYHPSRDWMKAFAAAVSPQLASDERIVGEYLFARHSISYKALPSYFLGFAWFLDDVIQAWDKTENRLQELGLESVPILYRGPFSDAAIDRIVSRLDFSVTEGFVVRTTEGFTEAQMASHMAKYVRPGHVQSETHWMKAEIIKNGLAR